MFRITKGAQIVMSRLSTAHLEAYSSLREILEHFLLIWAYSSRHIPALPSTIPPTMDMDAYRLPSMQQNMAIVVRGCRTTLRSPLWCCMIAQTYVCIAWSNTPQTPTKMVPQVLRISLMPAVKFSVWTDSSSVSTLSSTAELRPMPYSPPRWT